MFKSVVSLSFVSVFAASAFAQAKKIRFSLLTALFAFLTAATVLSQVENGVITGLVKDSSGAAINKAQVTLRDTATGLTAVTSTDGQGLYVSPPLNPGEYEVKVEATGFKGVLEHVRLEVAQRATVDTTLSVGAASETVEVQETALQLDTDSSTVSDVRSEQAVHDLPLDGRNFAELLGLSAGVIPANSQVTTVHDQRVASASRLFDEWTGLDRQSLSL
jgi:hypothetical protein